MKQVVNKLSLHHLFEALKIVYKSSPKWTVINSIVTIIRGGIPLLLLYVVKQLIDVVNNHMSNIDNDPQHLIFIVALTAVFFLLNSVSGSVSSLIRERQSHFVNDYVQNIIHTKTVNIDYKYFEDANYQDIFFRALNDASFRPARIFYSILQTGQNALTLLLILIILSNIHWALIPLLIASSLPIFYFRISYTRKLYDYRKMHTEDERRVHYFNRLLTAKDFAKELRIFNLGQTFKREYEYFKDELRDKQWLLAKSKTISEILVQIFATLVLIVVIAYVVIQTTKGQITSGSMAMYFLALQRAYSVLQGLLNGLSALYEDNLFLRNFTEFRSINIEKQLAADKFPVPIKESIELRSVSFKYPNTSKWVLKDINLTIPKGQTVALVGNNGCGKSTLVKLLSGLHQPNEGAILVDGQNWQSISQNELSKNISVIFQDFMLYNVSAGDNIRYGSMQRENNPSLIEDAAQKAGIKEVFSNLPKGFDTTLGTLFKGSQMLSRGEWQRTALARSFFNEEAQLVILDEPTSSLDAFTEANLIAHFKDIIKDRTALIVSHRLSTIKLADMVVVMKDAGIAEIGSPEELLKQKGVYYQMIESLK